MANPDKGNAPIWMEKSLFYATNHKAGDEVLLDEWIDNENREHSENHDGHLGVVIDIITTAKGLIGFEYKSSENNLKSILSAVIDEHDYLEISVPVADEIEENYSCENGYRKRNDYLQEDNKVITSIEFSRFNQ